MITPEAWTPVIINSQCSSIKWIERSTEYVLPRIQVYIYLYTYGADTNYGVAPILGIPLMKGNNTKILQ